MKEMKNRTFTLWVFILIVLILGLTFWGLSSRNNANSPTEVTSSMQRPFDAKATIKMKDLIMEADINKTDIGMCTIKINEPKSLRDMKFQYDGNDMKVSYKGISVKLNENSKLMTSLASLIVNSIDTAASPSGVDVKIDGNAIMVSGNNDAGKFNIKLDKKTGSMISLSVPQVDFECNFDDFIFSK